jgi:four helix bundle protein
MKRISREDSKSESRKQKHNSYVFKFEKLIVWQKAIDLSAIVNNVAKKFPKEEIYVLASQIKRAADSISLNIAEGSTGQTNPEFKRFLGIALRSDVEVVSCIHLAKRRNIINEEDFDKVYKACEEILVMINALKKSLN